MIPWLFSIERATAKQAFLRSYLIGLLFFGGTLWWVTYVTIPGTILLVAYLALYLGVWGWLVQKMVKGGGVLLGLPGAWVVLEYLRSHLLTGFGWNLLAHTQWNWIPIIQSADLTGVWGISFLVVLVNVALYLAFSVERRAYRKRSFLFAKRYPLAVGLCLAAALGYGTFRLNQLGLDSPPLTTHDSRPPFRVAVVQGNIPQTEKWDQNFQEEIWHRYETLTDQAAQSRPDLIIWPETAVPGFLEEPQVFERVQKLAQTTKTTLLVGAPVTVYNSACLLNPQGNLIERYDKVHLVPFGEYVPLGPLLEWLREFVLMGDFSGGHRFTVFQTSDIMPPFSVLICFEDLFPDLSRRFVQEGARWLVVITNDAWFRRSAASLQHLQASVFRAIEERVWIVRAANTGWSGFVDPVGRRNQTVSPIPRFVPGVAAGTVQFLNRSDGRTVYSRWGDWFVWVCLGIIGCFNLQWKRWISLSNKGLQS